MQKNLKDCKRIRINRNVTEKGVPVENNQNNA